MGRGSSKNSKLLIPWFVISHPKKIFFLDVDSGGQGF
jgi:hypothetical protein